MQRGIVNDEADWYKYFKCSEIDPTCMKGEQINAIRRVGLKKLFWHKVTHFPLQTAKLLWKFSRHMSWMNIAYILFKPFLGKTKGATKNEVLSRSVEHRSVKDAAQDMTLISDEAMKKEKTLALK